MDPCQSVRIFCTGLAPAVSAGGASSTEEMDYAKPSPTYAKSVDQFLAQVRSPGFFHTTGQGESGHRPSERDLCFRAWVSAPASRCAVMRFDLTMAHVARAPDARWQQTAAHGLEALACDCKTIRSCLTAWTSEKWEGTVRRQRIGTHWNETRPPSPWQMPV